MISDANIPFKAFIHRFSKNRNTRARLNLIFLTVKREKKFSRFFKIFVLRTQKFCAYGG